MFVVRDGRKTRGLLVLQLNLKQDLTDTFCSSGARIETVIALAAVASHCVDTAAVLTDARLGTALVQVCQCIEQRMGG